VKRFISAVAGIGLGAAFLCSANAKTLDMTSVNTWSGTWKCVAGNTAYTETFTPIYSGKAMRVTVTGAYASDGTAVYDPARKAWIYAFVNGDGSYATMNGPVSGSRITFKQIFPAGDSVEAIRGMSPMKYVSTFTMTSHGKKIGATEVCTKS